MNYISAPGIITARRKIDNVDKAAARAWGINPYKLYDRTRKNEIVEPRQVAFYYKNKVLKIKPRVLQELSGFDHATVNHSCKVVQNMRDTCKIYRAKYEQFLKEI